jgi:hypothetical protein
LIHITNGYAKFLSNLCARENLYRAKTLKFSTNRVYKPYFFMCILFLADLMDLAFVYMFPTLHQLLNDCSSPTIDTRHVTTLQQWYQTALPIEQTISHYEVMMLTWEMTEDWQRHATSLYDRTDGTLHEGLFQILKIASRRQRNGKNWHPDNLRRIGTASGTKGRGSQPRQNSQTERTSFSSVKCYMC